MQGVPVELWDAAARLVATATTDDGGRVEVLAEGLACGKYQMTWHLGGFIAKVSATVSLDAERRYHLPVVASGHSAVVYLGA